MESAFGMAGAPPCLNIVDLPPELLLQVFKFSVETHRSVCDPKYRELPHYRNIRNLRLQCRKFREIGAALMFRTIYVELLQSSIFRFGRICHHPSVRQRVRFVHIYVAPSARRPSRSVEDFVRACHDEFNLDRDPNSAPKTTSKQPFGDHSSIGWEFPGMAMFHLYESLHKDQIEDIESGVTGNLLGMFLALLPKLRAIKFNDNSSFPHFEEPQFDPGFLPGLIFRRYPNRFVRASYCREPNALLKPIDVCAKLMVSIQKFIDMDTVKVNMDIDQSPDGRGPPQGYLMEGLPIL